MWSFFVQSGTAGGPAEPRPQGADFAAERARLKRQDFDVNAGEMLILITLLVQEFGGNTCIVFFSVSSPAHRFFTERPIPAGFPRYRSSAAWPVPRLWRLRRTDGCSSASRAARCGLSRTGPY